MPSAFVLDRCSLRWPKNALFCAALMLSCATTAQAADGTFRIFDWVGHAYWNKQERLLDRCSAQTTNADKITITYSLDRDYVWALELSSPSWRFNKGASFEITFGADHGQFLRLRAIAGEPQTVRVQIPDSLSFFEALRKIFRIQLIAGGMRSQFNLMYDNQILTALTQCVVRYGTSGKDRAAIASWLKTYAKAGNAGHDPAIHKEAEALAAGIMSAAEMPNDDKLARGDTAGLTGDAFRKLDKIIFSLTIVPRDQAPEMKDLPRLIVGADAQRCRGDFFSAALPDTIEKLRVARAFTNCLMQDTVKSAYYLAVPRKLGGIYLVAIIASDVGIVSSGKLTARDAERRIRGSIAVALEKFDKASGH